MKIAFCTLGCKVNQYETDLMMQSFSEHQDEIVTFEEKADVYVINSCSVTNLATRKTRQMLSRAKKQGGIVVLCGCYAQEKKESYSSLASVDLIIGNEEKENIVEIVSKFLKDWKKEEKKQIKTCVGKIEHVKMYQGKEWLRTGRNIRESVKIEDGCNHFCSYCIIPYVRGRVRSRKLEEIEKEVEALVKSGVGEIVLVGIEIASYGKDLEENLTLVDVVERISKIPELKRIRLGSIEPRILTKENIKRLAKVKLLCPHFHLSVQSLDNEVLKRMNRKYKREDIFVIVENLKKEIKGVALTCDIIVGFPGETDEEFQNTLEGVKKVGFYEVHVFKYSKRKWTRAATMEHQVDGKIAIQRSQKLMKLAETLKMEYQKSYLGQKKEVLFEQYQDGYLYGYTKNYMRVKVEGDRKLWGLEEEVVLNSVEEEGLVGSM